MKKAIGINSKTDRPVGKQTSAADQKSVDMAASRIFKKHIKAFKELAK